MSRIDDMIAAVIAREGGYTDNPNDAGGATNHGVSLRYAKSVGLDLDHDGDVDADDIREVTIEEAARLYSRDFYERPRIAELPLEIQPQMLDCSINHGPPQAIKFLQRVLVLAGFMPSISANGRPNNDGVLGPVSLAAARQAQTDMGVYLGRAILEERIAFYKAIVRRRPDQAQFLSGWLTRAAEAAA